MGNTTGKDIPLSTITQSTLDLDKYAGVWYVIASTKQSHQEQCEQLVSFYIKLGEKLEITNYCIAGNEITEIIRGHAVVPDKTVPSKLEISWDKLLFGRTGKYWIYDTDYTTYSIVGGGDKNTLWILSRTKAADASKVKTLLEKVKKIGYNVNNLLVYGGGIS